MGKIKLTYFDIDGGRAEPARIALSIAGIEFEDHRVSFPQFQEMRAGTPLNALPIVEIDGIAYTQSNAMIRYFGRLAGLYPSDSWQAFLCDEILEITEDAINALSPSFGLEGEELKKARTELCEGMYARCLKLLDTRLGAAGGEYFADHRFTVADLKVYLWVRRLKSGGLDHVPADLPDRLAPGLVRHMERVASQPGVAAYYAARGR